MTVHGYRLSPHQRRLWALGPAPYAAQRIVRLDGVLDVARLRDAIASAVAEHEVLRARLAVAGGEPLQVIGDEPSYDWAQLEPSAGSPEDRLRDHLEAPSEVARGPALRAALVALPDGAHLLGLALPALWGDRAALQLVAERVIAPGGRPGPVSFLAFAEWQHELLARGADGAAFWAEQHAAAPAVVRLPLERTATAGFTPTVARVARLDRAATAALAGATGEDLESVVLAVWCALVARLTGQVELDVAIVGDGRQTSELAAIVGLLARWLPVRARVPLETSIPALAGALVAAQRTAREWQRYFVWPVEPGAPRAGRDFPSIAFVWTEGSDAVHDRAILDRCHACVSGRIAGGALAIDLLYDAAVLSPAAGAQLCAQLGSLLRQVCDQPARAIGALSIGTPGAPHGLAGTRRTAAAPLIHRAFEAQAARHGERIAIAFEGQTLSYAALEARANQLAHALRGRGVGPEVRVGLCLERSLEMIVGILGVLKAGGAYVPLDPDQPAQRLALLIEDIQAPVVITSRAVLARRPRLGAAGAVVIVADGGELAHERTTPPTGADDPARAAYVLFTSGSTGRPKGVVIEHRQLASYVASVIAACELPEAASYATVSTFAADLGNTVVFPALVTGSTLHIVSAERASDPAALVEYIARHPIDCLKIVPSHLEALLSGAPPEALLPRRRLILGGESSALPWVRALAGAVPGCTIYNHYGPTETTVGVLTHRFDPARALAAQHTVPLETVVHDTAVYVVDAALRPVPPGVIGDVYVAGAAVGRGYLGKPALTAEVFLPDPHAAQPGARMYRTGDRGRVLEDGTFEFLGRADNQVKFHGHRIELAELRLAINQHPQIRNSLVRLTKDGAGNTVLAAYYVSRQPVDHDELRRFLREHVIEEVLPNVYIHLKKLPLTLNGKVHVDALPSIEEARQRARRVLVAPRTDAEHALARIWCDVLHLSEISVDDNFFSLGGDSILAILVVSRANQAGLRLTPRQVFQHQSIAELARVAIESAEAHDAGPVVGEVPLLPSQLGFLAHTAVDALDAAVFIAWLEVHGPIDPARVEQALAALWRHHDALRLRVVVEDGAYRASIDAPDDAPSVLARIERDTALPVVERGLREAIRLADGRAVAAAWLDGGAAPPRLAIAVHRLAVDAVSWRILAEQLELACAQLEGGACALPPRSTSIKAWAEQLAVHAGSPGARDELAYWTREHGHPVVALPRDLETGASGAHDVIADRAIAGATGAALLDDAPTRLRCALDELLLAALGEALCGWAGGPVAIDVERHGRAAPFEAVDLSRTVGWLTTTYPVRLTGEVGVAGARAVKEHLRAVPGDGLGHGVLRYLGDPEAKRQLAAAASPSLVFRYTGVHLDAEARTFRPLDGEVQAMTPQHAIAVIARVVGGGGDRQLHITWLARGAHYDRQTVERLATRMVDALVHLATGEAAPSLAPSDVPLAGLDQAGLDKLLARLK